MNQLKQKTMKKHVLILSILPIDRFDFFKKYMEKHYNVIVHHSLLKGNQILEMPIVIDSIIFSGNVDAWQINQVKKLLSEKIYYARVDSYYNHHNIAIHIVLTFFTLKEAFDNVIQKLFSDCVVSEV